MLSKQQKRLIVENPNLNAGVLARFIGVPSQTVNSFRFRNNIKAKWHYKGVGAPFLSVRIKDRYSLDVYYQNGTVATTGSILKAFKLVDHLIWCINNDMFKQPRIEHPYFEKLKLGVN